MNKITSIIIIILVTFIVFFAGCVGKETSANGNKTGNSNPKQVVSTPTQALTATPTPKENVNVTLKAGYNWYQNNDLNYKIGYPENWQINDQGMGTVTVNNVSGWQNIVTFSPSLSNELPQVIIAVDVHPNTLTNWWEDSSFGGIDTLKKGGVVSKFGNTTIKGREGFEIIYDPLMLIGYSKTHVYNIRMIVFESNDLYYQIWVYAFSASENGQMVDSYNKYNNTFDDVINSFIIEK